MLTRKHEHIFCFGGIPEINWFKEKSCVGESSDDLSHFCFFYQSNIMFINLIIYFFES